MQGTILVATASQGVLRSTDDGKTWARTPLDQALEFDGIVRCLELDPRDSSIVYAGADVGLVRSTDAGLSWERVDSPFNDIQVWKIAFDPSDPERMLVGTGAPDRAYVYRTIDGCRTWEKLPPQIPERCEGVSKPRILAMTIDSESPDQWWFGIEEGGLWRSNDAGDSWDRLDRAIRTPDAVTNSDIHCVMVHPGLGDLPKTHIVVTVNAIWQSRDDGQTWKPTIAKEAFGLRYARAVVTLEDNKTLLFACGDSTPGSVTKIYRSTDLADSWQETEFTSEPGSTVWAFGTHPSDPELVFAGTKYGNLLRSVDAGRTWTKEWREFPEITDVVWTPVTAPEPTGH